MLKVLDRLFLIILSQFFIISSAISEIIKDFKITGNERLSKETIIMFSNLKIGENVNQNDLNNSL